MKKIVSLFSIIVVLSTMFISVYAASPLVKILATENGNVVKVEVKLSGDISNMRAYEIFIGYDKTKVVAEETITQNKFSNWVLSNSYFPTKELAFNRISGLTIESSSNINLVSGTDKAIATMSFTKIDGQKVDDKTFNVVGPFKPVALQAYSNINTTGGIIDSKATPTLMSYSFNDIIFTPSPAQIAATEVKPTFTPNVKNNGVVNSNNNNGSKDPTNKATSSNYLPLIILLLLLFLLLVHQLIVRSNVRLKSNKVMVNPNNETALKFANSIYLLFLSKKDIKMINLILVTYNEYIRESSIIDDEIKELVRSKMVKNNINGIQGGE